MCLYCVLLKILLSTISSNERDVIYVDSYETQSNIWIASFFTLILDNFFLVLITLFYCAYAFLVPEYVALNENRTKLNQKWDK